MSSARELGCKDTALFSKHQEKNFTKTSQFIRIFNFPPFHRDFPHLLFLEKSRTFAAKIPKFNMKYMLGCRDALRPSALSKEEARAIMDDVSRRNLAYEPLTEHDDTMMQRVVAYYKEHGTAGDVMEAYYLQGSVCRDLREAPRAMEAFLNGINAAGLPV